jgi:hypothetical protein
MFRIRREQKDAFSRREQDRLVEELTAWLKQEHPDEARLLGGDEVRRFVREETEHATTYNLLLTRHIKSYVELAFALKVELGIESTSSFVRDVMIDGERSPAARLDVLAEKREQLHSIMDDHAAEMFLRALETFL